MTGVLIKGKFGQTGTERDDTEGAKEKAATYKPRRDAWHRSFSHSLRKKPTLPTL